MADGGCLVLGCHRNHPFLPRFRLLRSLKGQRVTQFACGGEHSAALMANDDVYCWGAG